MNANASLFALVADEDQITEQERLSRVVAALTAVHDVNALIDGGMHLIEYAVRRGRTEIVRLLLENGADADACRTVLSREARAPLALAAEQFFAPIVDLLLQYGADPDIGEWHGGTALHIAVQGYVGPRVAASLHIVRALLSADANPNVKNQWDETPLHKASNAGVVPLLVHRGADVNARTVWESTPLHYAARDYTGDVVEALLENGADARAVDEDGNTPLHFAVSAADDASALSTKALLAFGADPNARNEKGYSPLHIAAGAHNFTGAELILAAGADPEAVDADGRTPLALVLEHVYLGSDSDYRFPDRYSEDDEYDDDAEEVEEDGGPIPPSPRFLANADRMAALLRTAMRTSE